MCLKKLMLGLLVLIIAQTSYAEAKTYRLLVDNNTKEHFAAEEADDKAMPDLAPLEKAKLYEVDWVTNQLGSTVFLIRFYLPGKGYYEVFASGFKDKYPRLRCWSRAFRCQIMVHNDNEGKLTINYRN